MIRPILLTAGLLMVSGCAALGSVLAGADAALSSYETQARALAPGAAPAELVEVQRRLLALERAQTTAAAECSAATPDVDRASLALIDAAAAARGLVDALAAARAPAPSFAPLDAGPDAPPDEGR